MISIKIECACGQHYAFEVQPVNGRMPGPVACPACGADGSAAANEIIAQRLAAPVALTAAPPSSVPAPRLAPSVAPASPARRGSGLPLPGQPDRNQIMFEARAKISWGDPPQDVVKYLMINGFSGQEVSEFVNDLFDQRAAAIRSKGVVYICAGVGMICVPIVTYLISLRTGLVYTWAHASSHLSNRGVRGLVVTIAIGLAGLGLLIKGLFMVFAAKSTSGDVSEQ
jgi:hypothetical protein